jgi:hypothetical protein
MLDLLQTCRRADWLLAWPTPIDSIAKNPKRTDRPHFAVRIIVLPVY